MSDENIATEKIRKSPGFLHDNNGKTSSFQSDVANKITAKRTKETCLEIIGE
jgi:hypothetical protein